MDATCIECAEAKKTFNHSKSIIADATCIECAEAKRAAVCRNSNDRDATCIECAEAKRREREKIRAAKEMQPV